MEISNFIGKTVVCTKTKTKYQLYSVTSPVIEIISPELCDNGCAKVYRYPINHENPFETGELVFEEPCLLDQFLEAYSKLRNSIEGYKQEYYYWTRGL